MDSSRFLVTGANGQLGNALRQKYPDAHFTDASELDITSQEAIESFDWSNITHIINAAAYTNVDGAETNQDICMSINAGGVANLASAASAHNLTLVHISTDYVFDGTKDNHTEDEELSPISVYGRSKAEGDKEALKTAKHYILRSSWVIGEGHNFVRIMMGLAEKNISPAVVNDQIGRLTFTSELVKAIDHLLNNQSPYGIYNVTNSGDPASWADITREIFKLLGRDDLTVTNTTTKEYFAGKENIAPRPLKSTLNLDKIKATGFEPRDWKDNLKEYIDKEFTKS